MPKRERKRVPNHKSNILKGSLPHPGSSYPSLEHRISKYLRLSKESKNESRKEFIMYCISD